MFYFIDDKSITVQFGDGTSASWSKNDKDYQKAVLMCKNANWVAIKALHNPIAGILSGEVKLMSEEELPDIPLTKLIKVLQDKGILNDDIEAVKPFLINCLENPFVDAAEELFEFCKHMDFEITEDGCFLAYKKVRPDLGSLYDKGITQHVIGEVTEVTAFDTDREQTCSKGLHFCAKDYLKHYGPDLNSSDAICIIVKVNPKHVCAIPIDYNGMKGRCTQYITVGVLDPDLKLEDVDIEEAFGFSIVAVNDRIDETYHLMTEYNDPCKVAEMMGIKISTVKRNLRKYNARHQS